MNHTNHIQSKKIVLGVLILLSNILFSQISTTTYDFESLTSGVLIAGQDNWQYMGNLNTSGNIGGSGGCAIPSGAAPTTVSTTATSGAYIGGKAVYNPGNTGNSHGFASRKNNAGWNYSIPVASDYLIFEFDYDNGNYWGEYVNLAYDKNADGNYSSNCVSPDANELGIGLLIGSNIKLYLADGTQSAAATRVGSGWTKYRITVDLRANGGQGAGSVCYRVLGTNGPWISIAGLQNINMLINPASANQNNLQNLDGIVVQQEAGGKGKVDNISITTIKNSLLVSPTPLCSGGSFSLTTLTIPSTSSYNWLSPSGTTYTTATNNFSLTNTALADNGTFTVTTTDCSALSWTVPVTVNPTPILTSANTVTICSGSDPNLVLTSNVNSTYTWIATNNSNVSGESLVSQTTSTLNNTLVSSSTVPENVIYAVTPTSTLGGCIGSVQQVTVTVNPNIIPSALISVGSATICAGSSANFTATSVDGGTSPGYQWQVNGANAGIGSTFNTSSLNNGDVVSVVLTSNALCASTSVVNSNSITITVNPLITPSVMTAVSNATICEGTTVTFTATPTNGGTMPSYQWQVNGVNAGATPVFSISTLSNGDVVTVILTSNAMCVSPVTANSNSVTMVVTNTVSPSVNLLPSSTNICSSEAVSFTATSTNGGTSPSYQWQVNGVNAGTNSPNFTSSTLSNGDVVTLVLSSNAVCAVPSVVVSNAISMNVTVTPTAAFNYSPTDPTTENTTVNFQDQSSNSTNWFWTFQTDANSTTQNPSYGFPGAGTYTVTLLVSNGTCTSTATQVIVINEESEYYIPNTFTPNGDNINEVFKIVGTNISNESFDLIIYNRWGQIVSRTSDPLKGWDGTVSNGNDAPAGIYVYMVNFKFNHSQDRINKVGDIHLFR